MTSTIEQSQPQQQALADAIRETLGIDRDKETLIALCDVRKHVLETSGRKLGLPTLYKWYKTGVCGVKLEVVFILNRAHTSLEALRRFDERVTAAKLASIDNVSIVKAKLAGGAK